MRFLWTEDTGAGFHFWKLVNRLFFGDELLIESKGSIGCSIRFANKR